MPSSTYKVTDRLAARRAVDRDVRRIAQRIQQDLIANTPVDTGRLRSGWELEKGRAPAVWLIVNKVPYGRAREFGTRRGRDEITGQFTSAAGPFMGPVLARWRSQLGRRR